MNVLFNVLSSFLYYATATCGGTYIIYKVCNKLDKKKTEELTLQVGWKSALIVSKFSFLKYIFNPFFRMINLYNYSLNKITVIQNGEEITDFNKYSDITDEQNKLLNNFDFVLHKYENKMIRNSGLTELKDEKIKESNIKFISVTIRIKDYNLHNSDYDEYELNLSLPYNFYMVGNIILDKKFLLWFLLKNFNIDINAIYKYKVTIIDNNANQIFLKSNEALLLDEDSYSILQNIPDINSETDSSFSSSDTSESSSEDEKSEDEKSEDEKSEDEKSEDEKSEDEKSISKEKEKEKLEFFGDGD